MLEVKAKQARKVGGVDSKDRDFKGTASRQPVWRVRLFSSLPSLAFWPSPSLLASPLFPPLRQFRPRRSCTAAIVHARAAGRILNGSGPGKLAAQRLSERSGVLQVPLDAFRGSTRTASAESFRTIPSSACFSRRNAHQETLFYLSCDGPSGWRCTPLLHTASTLFAFASPSFLSSSATRTQGLIAVHHVYRLLERRARFLGMTHIHPAPSAIRFVSILPSSSPIRDFLTEEAQILLLSCRPSPILSAMAPSGRLELTRHGRLSFGFSAAEVALVPSSPDLPVGSFCHRRCDVVRFGFTGHKPKGPPAAEYSSLTASFDKVNPRGGLDHENAGAAELTYYDHGGIRICDRPIGKPLSRDFPRDFTQSHAKFGWLQKRANSHRR